MAPRLVNAAISFVNGLVCAQVDNDWGPFDDQSDAGPFGLFIRNRQAPEPLQSGGLTIRIDPQWPRYLARQFST